MKKTTSVPETVLDEVRFASPHAEPQTFENALVKRRKSRGDRGITYEYFHDRDTSLTASYGVNSVPQAHFHRCIEILYIFDGEMRCEVEDETFVAGADDIVFRA